jgi:exodeoxyribonuclease VII large subunit
MPRGQRDLSSFLDRSQGETGPSPAAPPGNVDNGPRVMTVTEVTGVIAGLIEGEPVLQDARVSGEVSNVRPSSRGHLYFTLKDAGAQMPCAMFGRGGARVAVELKDGDQVVARGHVEVYPPHGKYQLIVEELSRRGVGDLYQRVLELKERLEKEGLFAPERKRPLPALPRRVGVVTSSTGAVFHDIVRVVRRRWPHVRITLAHSAVQGEGAAAELVEALRRLWALGDVDVIIIGRGGGSFEDLWTFNEEPVARAIVASPVPVVSAVGHETDYTIADFVADVRAPTPSAAAELVVPRGVDEEQRLSAYHSRLLGALSKILGRAADRLAGLLERAVLRRPLDAIVQRRQRLDDLDRRLHTEARHLLERRTDELEAVRERLVALGPVSTLRRGYAIALDAAGGLVKTVERVREGDALELVLADGRVDATARRVRPDAPPDGET